MLNFLRSPLCLLLAAGWTCGCSFANESLVLSPGVTAAVSIPAISPFTSLGSTRLEMRINHRITPTANTDIFQHSGFTVLLAPNGEICAVNYIDSTPAYGNMMCADVTGVPDIVLRVQRDTVQQLFEMEVHSAANDWTATSYCGSKSYGTQGNVMPCPIATVNYWSWAGTATLGGALTNVQLAWLKWYSTVVPPGTGAFSETNPADLADWRFETGTNNIGTSGLAVTIGALKAPNNPVGATAGVIFAPTPILPPACNAGQQQVFRAGYPAQLDGTGSYPLDGGTALQFAWQQVSGPFAAQWTNAATAQPTVSGLVFGSYVFQLTVTDGSNQTTTCTVKHGAVATDNNGVVITGNNSVDALIGPQIRFGANPWPWFDNRHKAAADVQNADLDPYYASYWDTPGPGTIAVSANSATVLGFGTTFTTTFCQGPGNPNQPKNVNGDLVGIIVWYPTTTAGLTGRRLYSVLQCQSDTSLTLSSPWATDVPGGSGINYSYTDDLLSGNWMNNVDPGNFYDNVVAFYTLYYRSGIDDYLTAARKLADRYWLSPRIDQGAACGPNSPGTCTFPRNLSILGLVLRAVDGRPDMWPGLRLIWDKFIGYDLGKLDPNQTGIWDLREEAYHLAMISYCALVDPDPVHIVTCKTAVSQSFAKVWTPFKFPDGSWAQLYYGGMGGSWGYSSWDTNSSVTLTTGSATVTANGISWSQGFFPSDCLGGGSGGCGIWFTNSPSKPANNAAGDPTTYQATFTDATHLTLDRPYQGVSGVHGWALTNAVTAGLIGWGAQPYMMGIMATAFDFAARGIADTDPTTSALAHSYNVAAANWIKNNAYWPLRKGLYYGAQFANCQAPIADTNLACTAGNNASAARTLSSETMRGIGAAYAYSGDSSLQTFGDTLFSAMFSKPGTGGPNPDGYYVSDWDNTIGWYMAGTPPVGKAPKYFGMFFGFGDNSSWPAYRLGASSGTVGSTAYIPIHSNGPVKVRITTVAPNGEVSRQICSASPCAVSFDARQGEYRVMLDYLTARDVVIFTENSVVNRTSN